MEDGRCKLGLQGRLELVRLIEQGSTLRAAAAALSVAPATAHRWWHRWQAASDGERATRGVSADAVLAAAVVPVGAEREDEQAILEARAEDQLRADAAAVADRPAPLDDLEGAAPSRRRRVSGAPSARRARGAMSGPRPVRCCTSTPSSCPSSIGPGHWAHGDRSEPHRTRQAGKVKVIGVIDDHTRLAYCETARRRERAHRLSDPAARRAPGCASRAAARCRPS